MLNYRDCTIEDFQAAMNEKNTEVKNISTEHLYILYTKFMADAHTCYSARTSYGTGLGIESENQARIYKEELKRRGINLYKEYTDGETEVEHDYFERSN